MVVEARAGRHRAVVGPTTASRTTQSLATILNMRSEVHTRAFAGAVAAYEGHRVAGIVAAIMAALFATMIQRDERVALFSEPLRPEQVSEVTKRLAEWNVGMVVRRRRQAFASISAVVTTCSSVWHSPVSRMRTCPRPGTVGEGRSAHAVAGTGSRAGEVRRRVELALRGVAESTTRA